MKKLIPCTGCQLCAIGIEAGFMGRHVLLCTRYGSSEVTEEDGCTMGEEGEPGRASNVYDVDLANYAVVWGC